MPNYCYAFSNGSLSMRTVSDDYVAQPGEFLSSPDQASPATLASQFPGWNPLSKTIAIVVGSAKSVCQSITSQIVPDATHQNAYQIAYATVAGTGESPTSGPLAAQFDALAASFGLSPSAFATLVIAVGSSGLQLSAALSTLETTIASATTNQSIDSAVAVFNTAIAAIVSEVNGAGVSPAISAPAPVQAP